MPSSSVASAVDISHEIFELLKRTGPLCASQIAVDLRAPLKKIRPVLEQLKQEGVVELRPDRDLNVPYESDETPWGLSRPTWLPRRAR
jgi:predicted ArsR family transcriptional regulator